jgi:hypothetical protein
LVRRKGHNIFFRGGRLYGERELPGQLIPTPLLGPFALVSDVSFLLVREVPWFSTSQCREVTRPMDDPKNENLVLLEKIDDAVTSEEDFAEVSALKFRNDSANARILEE